MTFRVIYAHGVSAPNADESSVFVRKHRKEIATAYTVRAPDDHYSIGWLEARFPQLQ